MRDRTRPTCGNPFLVGLQRRLYLSLFQDLRRRVAFHRTQPPQVGERNNRGRFATEVNHLIRLTRVWITGRQGGHTATLPAVAGRGDATARV